MLVYLDSVIVIYLVERLPLFFPRVSARLASLNAAGAQLAISDLTRLECRVKPIRTNNLILLNDFDQFFTAANVKQVDLPKAVYERATLIRARYNYKLGDALHLAAAVEAGCQMFLTHDRRLSAFPDITVEIMP